MKTLFVYDPATNAWSRKADLPQAVCGVEGRLGGVAQGVISGKLHVYVNCYASQVNGRCSSATLQPIVGPSVAAPPADDVAGAGAADTLSSGRTGEVHVRPAKATRVCRPCLSVMEGHPRCSGTLPP
jgi:hypothetical protein